MRLVLITVFFVASASNAAEMRTAKLTRESLDELKRRCEVIAKNERKSYVLLTGKLLQTRFKGQPIPTCIGVMDEGQPCRAKAWFPWDFKGILTMTNYYAPGHKVAFVAGDALTEEERQSLDLIVKQPYAMCVTPGKVEKGVPQFTLENFDELYHLKSD